MGLLCPTSQGANSFMFVHTMDTTGIYHTTECVFLVPCWSVLVAEKLIRSGSWCLPLVQRMEFSKIWWPLSICQAVYSLSHSSLIHHHFLLSGFPLSMCLSPSSSSFFSSFSHSVYSWSLQLLHLSPTVPAETTFSCGAAADGYEEGRAR